MSQRFPLMKRTYGLAAGLSIALALCLSACGVSSPEGERIAVVTVSNVYGSVVSEIGGNRVEVTALLNNQTQDPHAYEASSQDKLAVSKAQLVVVNGGGYDDFLNKLLKDTDGNAVINVVGLAEQDSTASPSVTDHADREHGEVNEHVWYSFPAMEQLVRSIEDQLSARDAAHAQDFHHRADKMRSDLKELEERTAAVRQQAQGQPMMMTEPVPALLLQACGLHDVTPQEFSHAVEAGREVSPAMLQKTHSILREQHVRFLAYNAQTEDAQTRELRNIANEVKVPVVEFAEILPEGHQYVSWMNDNIEHLERALGLKSSTALGAQ